MKKEKKKSATIAEDEFVGESVTKALKVALQHEMNL